MSRNKRLWAWLPLCSSCLSQNSLPWERTLIIVSLEAMVKEQRQLKQQENGNGDGQERHLTSHSSAYWVFGLSTFSWRKPGVYYSLFVISNWNEQGSLSLKTIFSTLRPLVLYLESHLPMDTCSSSFLKVLVFLESPSRDFSKFHGSHCPLISFFSPFLPLPLKPTLFSMFNKLGPGIPPLETGFGPHCCPCRFYKLWRVVLKW